MYDFRIASSLALLAMTAGGHTNAERGRDGRGPRQARNAMAGRLDVPPADLPDGLSGDMPVQPHLQKYFVSRLTQITSISPAVSPPRGAYRDRHGRGAG